MKAWRPLLFLLFLRLLAPEAIAQEVAIKGFVRSEDGLPLSNVNVFVPSQQKGTVSDRNGFFLLILSGENPLELEFSHVGYQTKNLQVDPDEDSKLVLNVELISSVSPLDEVYVIERTRREGTLSRIQVRQLDYLPGVSRNIEAIIKTMPGVSSGNEFSSQYSVRGGNFDENLVYINGIEIYRPLLIRSGQQEGLSIINPDLVASVSFSAGAFDARYGDKLSSVLDITYRRPTGFAGSASAGLLGGSMHIEGINKKGTISHMTAFRYKSNAYLLQSLEERGDYNPSYSDIQTYLNHEISHKSSLSFLGHFSLNNFSFIPQTRETSFGTFENAYGLKIYFDGQEKNKFETLLGALAFSHKPSERLGLNLSASMFRTGEQEGFDILGQYLINQLDNQLGSRTFGDSIMNIGVGSFLNHGRNKLDARVMSFSHKGTYTQSNHSWNWGISWVHQSFDHRMNEWKLIDSAGFSLPYSENEIILNDLIRSTHQLDNNRFSVFLQHSSSMMINQTGFEITGGVRTLYLDQTRKWYVSPRAGVVARPDWEQNMIFYLSSGVYYQPAFLRELTDFSGNLNREIKPQKAIHIVMGADYQFFWWARPFRFVSEVYFKKLTDLIPYVTDNVRILYSGNNFSEGYAVGIDFKINGEFVEGMESWASVSFMRAEEKLQKKFYENSIFQVDDPSEYIPRPTDQLFNFAMFFQDYLPKNPNYKVHIQMVFGSRLPFHAPNKTSYGTVFRMPSYKRVDLGFSRELTSLDPDKNWLNRTFKNVWLGLEIFNLLDIKNTASYLWFNSVSEVEGIPANMAVPNYLSTRMLNVRISSKF
jgi:hypothetical protein